MKAGYPCASALSARTKGNVFGRIAIASKGHWGYDPQQVTLWAARGDFSTEGLREKEVYVAEAADCAVAWAALIPQGELIWLDDLWVEPQWIGKGVGSLLLRHAVHRATELGGKRMWAAEPNSVGFYGRLGGRHLRGSEPTSWGRAIPVMGVDLPIS
jgi:GNAT superfamily N-acetyltransferase